MRGDLPIPFLEETRICTNNSRNNKATYRTYRVFIVATSRQIDGRVSGGLIAEDRTRAEHRAARC